MGLGCHVCFDLLQIWILDHDINGLVGCVWLECGFVSFWGGGVVWSVSRLGSENCCLPILISSSPEVLHVDLRSGSQ